MRVLMVHDCSYVGHELRDAIEDNFDDVHVEILPYPLHTKLTVFNIAIKIRKINPDIVHVHYCRYPAYAALLSCDPFIIHCHGTDIRHGINFWQSLSLAKSRQVLVSTPDLLKILPNAVWLPNPINLDYFKPLREHDGNKVLYYPQWYENIENELDTVCRELGYLLTVKKKRDIQYKEMPYFLNQFDLYVDRFTIKSYSKTALEAMACNLAVIGYRHNFKEALKNLKNIVKRRKHVNQQRKMLNNHDRNKVASSMVKIYRQVYKNS